MGNLSGLTITQWFVLGLVGWFFGLRLLERGVRRLNWAFERLYRAIETASGGRIKVSTNAPRHAARFIGGKVGEWIRVGFLTVADPFIEIARSFVPRYVLVPVPAAAEEAPARQDDPRPTPAAQPEPSSRPGEAEYLTAVAWFGLPPNCSQNAAAKAWAKMLKVGNPEQVNAAWLVICEYRKFRRD